MRLLPKIDGVLDRFDRGYLLTARFDLNLLVVTIPEIVTSDVVITKTEAVNVGVIENRWDEVTVVPINSEDVPTGIQTTMPCVLYIASQDNATLVLISVDEVDR